MIYPVATAVQPLEQNQLLVTFDNGERRIYDAKPLIRGAWFGKLRDKALFNTVHIAFPSVACDGGQDIAPDELYCASKPISAM